MLAYLVFGSFLLFGNDNESMESVENVVILDLGNGIIGIGIALLTMLAIKPVFKEINWWYKAILFIAYGIVYSMLSTYGICQTESCDHLPFGNIINYFVVLLFGFIMYLYVVNLLYFALGYSKPFQIRCPIRMHLMFCTNQIRWIP